VTVYRVLALGGMVGALLLGACGSEPRPEGRPAIDCTDDLLRGPDGESYSRDPEQGCNFVDDDGNVVPERNSTLIVTTTTTTTTPPEPPASRGFCTTDQLIGPEGKRYGRDPGQGCKFVDEDGKVLPDQ